MLKLLALGIIMTHQAFGSTPDPEAFCRDYLALRQEQADSRPKVNQALSLLFRPRSLIRAHQWDRPLPASPARVQPFGTKRVVYVLLGAPDSDESVVHSIRATQERIRRLPLIRELSRIDSIEACVETVKKDDFGYARMSDYLAQFKISRPHLEARKQRDLRLLVEKKLTAYQRRGWEIRFPASYFDLVSDLEHDSSVTEAMLIAHADPEGKLYDRKGTAIPKGFLLNLPSQLRKFILFSCHSGAVLEYYEAARASLSMDIHYPELEERYENLYRTSIPVVALRGMLPSAEASLSGGSIPERACRIDILLPEPSGRYELLLQNRWIGIVDRSASRSIAFDCSLLGKEKNIFKLHHAEGEARIPPRVSEMRLTTPGSGMVLLRVKEFVSSDGISHIQTIGTTGGHP